MLKIFPIENKRRQEELCAICRIPYNADDLAYSAYDDDTFLGISQFRTTAGSGILHNLVSAPGVSDFEAMFIMGRATMNFIDLCGLHTCTAPADAGDGRLFRSLGFLPQNDGSYLADMHDMFSGHCGGHTVKENLAQ